MKILILGAHGRLAAAVARHWATRHEISCVARPELDVADPVALESLLASRDYDIAFNGTGMTNVDRCETDREEARLVNAVAPKIMAEDARKKKARLIHISTDYVFDGEKPAAYVEDDEAKPLGWYGWTKRDGELAVLASDPSHLVVRVSWVFGPDKPSFIDAILDRARTSSRVEAIGDKYSSPTYACDVAGWLEPFFDRALPGGMFHACNTGICSWRDYGEFALQSAAAAGLPLATTTVASLRLEDMKSFVAPRPRHSALATERLARTIGAAPRHWQDAVRDYIHAKYAPVLPPA